MAKTMSPVEGAVRVGPKSEVILPSRITRALKLKKGDYLLARLVDRRLELVPATLVPKDQRWYWTPEWQAKEREADEDIALGRVKEVNSVDDLIKELKSQ